VIINLKWDKYKGLITMHPSTEDEYDAKHSLAIRFLE
jgi:hypothetical protein